MKFAGAILFSLFLIFSNSALAQTNAEGEAASTPEEKESVLEKGKELAEDTLEKGKEAVEDLQKSVERTPSYRQARQRSLTLNYSLLDMWTLGKFGASASWQMQERAWDLTYQKGSFGLGVFMADIGELVEERLHLVTRSYGQRTSFNWIYGIFYNDTDVSIGSDILNQVSQGTYPHADVLSVETAGISFGFSNRWQRRNGLTFGIDWIELNIPLVTLDEQISILQSDAEEGDKERVRDVVQFFRRIPTVALAKVYVGYSF